MAAIFSATFPRIIAAMTDPPVSITPLRKKRKVIMADSALRDLL
jgi:hypothetical protein